MTEECKFSSITEKLVVEVWKRQMLTKPLRTTDGQRLEVIYYGRHCCDHGPDFRGAMIAFDGDLRCGDVEIHVRDADWPIHKHQLDPSYDKVILHVVMYQNSNAPICKSTGQLVPLLCVAPHLAVDINSLLSLIDTTPYLPFRCSSLDDPDQIVAILDVAGQRRLRDKAASLEGDLAVLDPDEVLYRAIMVALGYTRNTAPFAQLAEIVPFSMLRAIALTQKIEDRSLAIQAFLLGKAGLLSHYSDNVIASPDTLQHEQSISRRAGFRHHCNCGVSEGARNEAISLPTRHLHSSVVHPKGWMCNPLEKKWGDLVAWDDGQRVTLPWRFGRVRPENFPTRRIAAASELFGALATQGLSDVFLGLLHDGEPESVCGELEKILMVRGLIGRARASEIIVNAILPFVVAIGQARDDSQLSRRAATAFRSYRVSSDNEITRHMSELMFGANSFSALRTACRQQGLLHLYKKWCAEKRCPDCPLSRVGRS